MIFSICCEFKIFFLNNHRIIIQILILSGLVRTSLCLNSSKLIFKWPWTHDHKASCIRKLISLQITKERWLFSVLKLYFEGNIPLRGQMESTHKAVCICGCPIWRPETISSIFMSLVTYYKHQWKRNLRYKTLQRDTRSFISFKTVFASLEMAFELFSCSVFMKVHQAYCKDQVQGELKSETQYSFI